MKYRPEIDGLRALAVLSVIFFHAGFDLFSGGYVGVDVFFVISGFLITSILYEQIKEQRFYLYRFYARRAQRLLPALAVVLFFTTIFSCWILLPRELKSFSESLVAVALASSNVLFWNERGYFDTSAELKPLLHTWSLAVEEQYYFIFPLVLMGIWRWFKEYLIYLLFGLLTLSLIAADVFVKQQASAAFYLLPFRAWELLIGAVSALLLTSHVHSKSLTRDQLLSLSGLVAVFYAIFTFDSETPTPSLITLIPTVGTALLLCFARQETWVYWFLSQRLMVGVGLISYSLYLWHQPLFALIKYRFGYLGFHPVGYFSLIVASIFLAYLSWRWVEQPFRKNYISPYLTRSWTVMLFIFILVLVGLVGHITQGFQKIKLASYSAEESPLITQLSNGHHYVSQRWRHLKELQPFREDEPRHKTKVMLIGDSYAQDLLNAIYEVGLDQEYQFSLYHISARCGNVWTEREIHQYMSAKDAPCLIHPRYQSMTLQQRISESDEVWLASSWRLWQVQYLPETLKNIYDLQVKDVKIFGRKDFGPMSFYAYRDQGAEVFKSAPMSQDHVLVNQTMKKLIPSDVFIDISSLMCVPSLFEQDAGQELGQKNDHNQHIILNQCSHRLEQGRLVSFDGKHLTRVGARYLGQKLLPLLSSD